MMGGSLGVGPVIEVAPVIHNITPPAGPMIEDLTPPPGPMPKPGKEPCDKTKINGSGRNYSEGEGEDDEEDDPERKPSEDRPLSNWEIEKLKEAGYDIHELKGGENASRRDLFKDRKGNVYIKPKGGRGTGEPLGINLNHY
ncbi:MAG: hypothetical protein IPJ35_02990 [Elusimicrobia bacterium]|nr:hypothetical protein [Elusimicrobiota bacterium]